MPILIWIATIACMLEMSGIPYSRAMPELDRSKPPAAAQQNWWECSANQSALWARIGMGNMATQIGRDVPDPSIKMLSALRGGSRVHALSIHPSFLLRITDAADKERECRNSVIDMRHARKMLAAARSA